MMEVNPVYETFGRDVPFEDITPIKKIYQPGFLSKSRFFNSEALRTALEDLCFLYNGEILVYFRNISGGMSPRDIDEKRKWWDPLQKFESSLGVNFPAGIEMEYYSGPEGDIRLSPEFNADNPPYQAHLKLFDDALQEYYQSFLDFDEESDQ